MVISIVRLPFLLRAVSLASRSCVVRPSYADGAGDRVDTMAGPARFGMRFSGLIASGLGRAIAGRGWDRVEPALTRPSV